MPYRIYVNDQLVPEEIIQQEAQQIASDITFQSIADPAERARQLREAAEQRAIDRVLIEQAALKDPRPVDAAPFEEAFQQQKGRFNCRTAEDEARLREFLEFECKKARIRQAMIEDAPKPSAEEIEAFYSGQRENFLRPAMFRAAHIVKHVNELQSFEEAQAGIKVALAELDGGSPFAEVADRHSDCKGNGGDLGEFPAGVMVADFEKAIDALEPGQRTGIFTTDFGFHIAELRIKKPPEPFPLDTVRERIEGFLLAHNQFGFFQRGVGKLRAEADIRFVP